MLLLMKRLQLCPLVACEQDGVGGAGALQAQAFGSLP
jgi:hypothetical protein